MPTKWIKAVSWAVSPPFTVFLINPLHKYPPLILIESLENQNSDLTPDEVFPGNHRKNQPMILIWVDFMSKWTKRRKIVKLSLQREETLSSNALTKTDQRKKGVQLPFPAIQREVGKVQIALRRRKTERYKMIWWSLSCKRSTQTRRRRDKFLRREWTCFKNSWRTK